MSQAAPDPSPITDIATSAIATLLFQRLRLTLAANYQRLLEEKVFIRTIPVTDKKLIRSCRTLLLSAESSHVLMILHKESEHVSEHARLAAKSSRTFERGKITQTQLARMLSSNKDDVLAAISRVQRISEAGQIYGLIQVEKVHSTRSHIAGTKLLDDFMRALGKEDAEAQKSIFSCLPSISCPASDNRG